MKKWTIIALLVLVIIAAAWFKSGVEAEEVKLIRVGTDPVWPPFEMVDEETKEIIGFDIDLIKAIGEVQGFEVEMVNINFDALIPGIAQCQFDAAASAITITEERLKQMLFSDPYIKVGQVMTVKEDNNTMVNKEDFKGKVIGGQTGTTGAIMAAEWEIEGVSKYKGYDAVDLAFMDLKNGQIDGVLSDSLLAEGLVKSLGGLKIVGDMYSSEELGFAVCKNQPELVDLINEGLEKVKEDGTFDKLVEKYFSEPAE